MRANYFIAVCDILGFSDLVRGNELDDVVTHSLGWFRKSLNHSLHKANFPTEVPPTADLDRHSKVGVAWFSDTVLFYTKNDTDEAVKELLSTVAWLVFETLQGGNTKVRGGLAYGEAYIDPLNALFVGQPIVDAYNLEKSQQWSGAALSSSAVNRLPEMARSGQYADWWVKPYDVPLKNQKTLQTLAIDWTLGIHHPSWRVRWSKDHELPTKTDWETKPCVCEKFVNTKKFHELYCHDRKRGT
ncbi:MAG: hypothetical protein IT524_07595 [Nitrosomonas sp.]|nr:hypothetical protein [Nitrosomonas sp.]